MRTLGHKSAFSHNVDNGYGETLGCLFWPSCGERKEGKLQLCVIDELLESIKPAKMKLGKSGSLATLLVGDANLNCIYIKVHLGCFAMTNIHEEENAAALNLQVTLSFL